MVATPSKTRLPQIAAGFNDAYNRMVSAEVNCDVENELTNCLQHLYRYANLRQKLWGDTSPDLAHRFGAVPGLNGALWARAFDTHDVVQIGSFQDRVSEVIMNMLGGVFWLPSADFTSNADGAGRHLDYENHLADKDAAATLRRAFDGLVNLD
jgi:hypothetical protein